MTITQIIILILALIVILGTVARILWAINKDLDSLRPEKWEE
jgi:hypothetical protein